MVLTVGHNLPWFSSAHGSVVRLVREQEGAKESQSASPGCVALYPRATVEHSSLPAAWQHLLGVSLKVWSCVQTRAQVSCVICRAQHSHSPQGPPQPCQALCEQGRSPMSCRDAPHCAGPAAPSLLGPRFGCRRLGEGRHADSGKTPPHISLLRWLLATFYNVLYSLLKSSQMSNAVLQVQQSHSITQRSPELFQLPGNSTGQHWVWKEVRYKEENNGQPRGLSQTPQNGFGGRRPCRPSLQTAHIRLSLPPWTAQPQA